MLVEKILYFCIFLNSLFAGTGVLFFRNPINAVISLIFLFINGAFLLVLHYIEFFAILYLLIYVGAIVIFFLFVVMLLDLKKLSGVYPSFSLFGFLLGSGFVLLALMFSTVFYYLDVFHLFNVVSSPFESMLVVAQHLYSDYWQFVLWIGVLLFIAMLGAIELNANKTSV